MEAPPLPHLSANYQDSIDSSPRSHNAETWEDSSFQNSSIPSLKLRFMCSYGGHIIPRPHDKSLCYVGGETRIVVFDRHSSLSDLSLRLSRTLLHGRPFILKYQLPHEELDSLISVSTDEDLDNMIEEYDRISTLPSKPLRLRLFLFFTKPETASSMGSLIDDTKHETWFVDALNHSAAVAAAGIGIISRGLSDSATSDHCFVNLDAVRVTVDKEAVKSCNNDVQSIHDSSAVENDSASFGSSSSMSSSMSNLPPIRVRVEDMVAPMNASSSAIINHVAISSENVNRGLSDDEILDQGAPVGFRKPPLPLQTLQNRVTTVPIVNPGFNLPSPDSVASDSSIASANSQSKPMYYQDQISRDPAIPMAETENYQLTNSQIPIQQLHDSAYVLTSQLDQKQPQQFVQTTTHCYHHHHPAAAGQHVPVPSYYPVYATPTQQLHHPIDQQYPLYIMPITQTQPAYNMAPRQSNTTETLAVAPNWPQASAYNDGNPNPLYPQKAASPSLSPEMAASAYRTAVSSTTPPLLQVHHNQFQQPYMGLAQMNYPSQSIAVASSGTANYGYEYTAATTTTPGQNIPPQYQTMTPAVAAAALSDASKQLPADATQQQIKNS